MSSPLRTSDTQCYVHSGKIPVTESPAPGSLNTADSSSLATKPDVVPPSMAKTNSPALNASCLEDTFPSDTPASFLDATSPPLPTPGPPPPPKDSHTSDSIHSSQGAAPPVPTKDAPSPPASSASESESGSEDEDDKEDGASGGKKKRNKRKLLQRLKEKLHVGHGHSHDEEAAYHAQDWSVSPPCVVPKLSRNQISPKRAVCSIQARGTVVFHSNR
ncbi:hypothetical protein DFH06DRAFT_1150431 [Mycena polygramma]|nr:hypothetical protein DFH06DRAFT_1150431 [Mycena polygramma]